MSFQERMLLQKGAAILAFKAVDMLQSTASEHCQTIKPDEKGAGIYEHNYSIYNQLYKINWSVVHKLNLPKTIWGT